jgi:hypothetical protein
MVFSDPSLAGKLLERYKEPEEVHSHLPSIKGSNSPHSVQTMSCTIFWIGYTPLQISKTKTEDTWAVKKEKSTLGELSGPGELERQRTWRWRMKH